MHQTVANVLRLIVRTTTITAVQQAEQVIDNALATAMHATKCSVNHTMRTSPGASTFCRDMFINVLILADFFVIQKTWQFT